MTYIGSKLQQAYNSLRPHTMLQRADGPLLTAEHHRHR